MSTDIPLNEQQAEHIRQACIHAAKEGFQDASMSGLCKDGAIETAISAIQKLDLQICIKKSVIQK